MKDEQAWRDWQRVEACLTFGTERWMWFVAAIVMIRHYVEPESGWLATGLVVWAYICQRAYIRHQDTTREETLRREAAFAQSLAEIEAELLAEAEHSTNQT